MATGTVILRPSADISGSWAKYPSDSPNMYSLINEEVCDEDTTYIFTGDGTVKVLLSGAFPSKIKIKHLELVVNGQWSNGLQNDEFIVSVNGISYSFGSMIFSVNAYPERGKACYDESLINEINNSLQNNETPEIILTINAKDTSGDYKNHICYISRVYLGLVYATDIGVCKKINDSYKPATVAYQKANGSWVEITEDECKSILQNNLICSGE